jgi:hypothetical protein
MRSPKPLLSIMGGCGKASFDVISVLVGVGDDNVEMATIGQ